MKAKQRLEVVDGLRGIAILSVVLFHSFPQIFTGGYIGVDIFFVISGFVISLRYLDALISREVTFSQFFLRRIRRLVPAYFALLAVTTAISIWLLLPQALVDYGASLSSQIVYAQNIAFWHIGDYFHAALEKPLLHTWSLAVEEQFYLVFPIAILLLRWRRKPALILLLICMLTSIATGYVIGHISPKTSFYWLPFRAWEFLAGIFASIIFQRDKGASIHPTGASAALIAGIIAIFAAVFFYGESEIFPSSQSVLAVLGTVMICLSQNHAKPWLKSVFTNRVMQHFGHISYSWYLWHWPLLSFFYLEVGHPAGLYATLSLTIFGYGLGAISYLTLEQPAMRSKLLIRPRAAILLMGSFLGFAGTAGIIIIATNGFISRFPDREQSLLIAQMDVAPYRCPLSRRLELWDKDLCKLNDVEGSGGVLIVGDSHADQAKRAIVELGNMLHTPVYLAKQDCRIIDYSIDFNCPESQWKSLMKQAKEEKITKLVLISFWPKKFDYKEFEPAFEKISTSGLHVFIQKSVPDGILFSPEYYLSHSERWGDDSGFKLSDYNLKRADQSNAFRKFANLHENVEILDPIPILCKNGECAFSRNGKPFYSDKHHMTLTGIRFLEPMYRKIFN